MSVNACVCARAYVLMGEAACEEDDSVDSFVMGRKTTTYFLSL